MLDNKTVSQLQIQIDSVIRHKQLSDSLNHTIFFEELKAVADNSELPLEERILHTCGGVDDNTFLFSMKGEMSATKIKLIRGLNSSISLSPLVLDKNALSETFFNLFLADPRSGCCIPNFEEIPRKSKAEYFNTFVEEKNAGNFCFLFVSSQSHESFA